MGARGLDGERFWRIKTRAEGDGRRIQNLRPSKINNEKLMIGGADYLLEMDAILGRQFPQLAEKHAEPCWNLNVLEIIDG